MLHHAAVEHGQAVGHRKRFLLVVGDKNGGDAQTALQRQQLGPHLHTQALVEVGQGLVKQQHLRLDHDGARQRHTLLLATRKLAGSALSLFAQAHHVEHRSHLGFDGGFVQTAFDQTKGHVVPHAQVRPQRVALKHHADVALPRWQGADVLAVHQHAALLGLRKTSHHAQQGAFARA